MGNVNINNAALTDYTNTVEYAVIDPMNINSPQGKETFYTNSNYAQQWGYFNQVADLRSALLLKGIWVCGGGYEADPETKVILEHVSGNGCDTFDDVLFNAYVSSLIFGDSYTEVIRDDGGMIINLKPLNCGTIRKVFDEKGMLKEYQQFSLTDSKSTPKTWKPDEIFNICNNRLADSMGGLSEVDALEPKILANADIDKDLRSLMHYQAKPFIMWKLKTDDPTRISSFISKLNYIRNLGEDLIIPDDDDTVKWEIVQLNPSAIALAYKDAVRNDFFRAVMLPQIMPGAAGQGTESESKVIYLGFERIVKREALRLEKHIWNQLYLHITLVPPVSLSADMAQDTMKDGQNQQLNTQPAEMQVNGAA